jgi:hypothetical protein
VRKTTTSLTDDLDGGPADETVRFELDGSSYELDLSTVHARSLRDQLRLWTSNARRVGAPAPVQAGTRRRTDLAATGDSRKALIRAWAAEAGHQVPARGKIPREVVAAYDAHLKSSASAQAQAQQTEGSLCT